MELISMTCRNCGGRLMIPNEADQVICQYCRTEYLVFFNEGAISIKLLSDGLQKIQNSTDKTASELALKRIREEKKKLHFESEIQAVILNLMGRNNEKYHLDFDNAIGQKIGLYDFNSSVTIEDLFTLRSYCEEALQQEKQRWFPDKHWIVIFEEHVEDIDSLIPKLQNLLEQEEFHKKAINS